MKRKLHCLILSLVLIFSLTHAPKTALADDAWVKLGRGMANIGTFYFEIVRQPSEMAKTERWPIAVFGGVSKGLAYSLLRLTAGIYETLTFI